MHTSNIKSEIRQYRAAIRRNEQDRDDARRKANNAQKRIDSYLGILAKLEAK